MIIYLKLFRINDSSLKIALGFGLGVFIGVMPGIGPIIALLLAYPLRVNRASALLGSVLFNTWVGIVTLLFSMRIGSAITGASYSDIYNSWNVIIKNFSWSNLLQASVCKILFPVLVGYFVISLCAASAASVIVYAIARRIKNNKLISKRKLK